MPNTLIVYYSRTGTTDAFAKTLQAILNCDIDKIDYQNGGKPGFLAAILQSLRKKIKPFKGGTHDAGKYDKIIFISPIWASALATPVRSYMAANKDKIKSYDLYVTCGSSGLEEAKKDAQSVTGKLPEEARQFRASDIKDDNVVL
ncbi:hypothetical protein FACS1894219_01420 [Clostridia bacterium]|nr:hypothetical protein FACS1894219_01420 [Clostridia bacterium]